MPGLTFSTSGDLTLGGDIFIDFGLGYNLDPAVGGFTIGNTFQGDEDGELVNLEPHDASQHETVLLWTEDAATTNGETTSGTRAPGRRPADQNARVADSRQTPISCSVKPM